MLVDEQNAENSPERMADEIRRLSEQLKTAGRTDLLLQAIGMNTLEELKIEAARSELSRLRITPDYRFLLPDIGNREVELQPVHKAVYLLFLAHPEGIEFKRLSDHRQELLGYYLRTARSMDKQKIIESVDHLVTPTDNAINEKCSRIKNAFLSLMDDYRASYYIISGHTRRHVAGSTRVWFERLKVITLPRHLVIFG